MHGRAAILAGGRPRASAGATRARSSSTAATILDRQLAELAPRDADDIADRRRRRGRTPSAGVAVRVVADRVPGLRAARRPAHGAHRSARATRVLVVACDMPFVTAALRRAPAHARRPTPTSSCRATERGYHPLCAVYTRACLEPVARRLADRTAEDDAISLEDVRVRVVTADELGRFGDPDRLLANVNTPDEYAGSRGASRSRTVIVSRAYRATLSATRQRDPSMILTVQRHVHDAIADAVRRQFGVADVPPFAVEVPPTRALGDLAVPVAFELARTLRKAPRAIAQELARRARPDSGRRARRRGAERLPEPLPRPAGVPRSPRVRRRGRAGARPARRARRSSSTRRSTRTRRRTSATCATRRSATRSCACCGSAARRSRCRTTSTTPASRWPTSSSASASSSSQTLDEVRRDRRHDAVRLLLLGPLRARHRVVRRRPGAARDPRRDAARHRARRQRRRGDRRASSPTASSAPPEDDGAAEHRLRPADVGGRHPAAAVLGARVRDPQGAGRRLPADGGPARRLLGDADRGRTPAAGDAERPRTSRPRRRRATREKVIVRSNGVVTYVGKDIAYQFWKFGLLGRDFHYRLVRRAGRRPAALGDDVAARADPRRAAVRRRAAHLQRHRLAAVVPAEAAQPGAARRSATARRPRTRSTSRTRWWRCRTRPRASSATSAARRRGREEAVRRGVGPQGARREDRRPARPAHRQGGGGGRASATRSSPPTSAGGSARRSRSRAIRYFMVKFSRGKLIAFDIDEALSFEGESGPYLQYAVVRANNIFHKLQEREGVDEADVLAALGDTPAGELAGDRTASARPLGARARGLAARRDRRAGGAVARVLGAGEVRVRPGADVQRVLPSLSDPERGAGRREALAGGRRRRTSARS